MSDRSVRSINADVDRIRAELAEQQQARLKGGDGDGTYGGMEGRVSKLEAHMEHMREDMAEVKGDLKTLIDSVAKLPTRSDLSSWKLQWTGLAVAAIAIVVGGIIGGLAWIQPAPEKAAQPQPIVITVPKG